MSDREIMMLASGYFERFVISRNHEQAPDWSVPPWQIDAFPVAGCPEQRVIRAVGPGVSADMFYAVLKQMEYRLSLLPQMTGPEEVVITMKITEPAPCR